MSELSLQERLARFLMKNPGTKYAKGDMCDLAREKMGVTAETVGRRLRVLHEATCMFGEASKTSEHERAWELAKGGKFHVEYRDKNHSFYWYELPKTITRRRFVPAPDGRTMMEIIEQVET